MLATVAASLTKLFVQPLEPFGTWESTLDHALSSDPGAVLFLSANMFSSCPLHAAAKVLHTLWVLRCSESLLRQNIIV